MIAALMSNLLDFVARTIFDRPVMGIKYKGRPKFQRFASLSPALTGVFGFLTETGQGKARASI